MERGPHTQAPSLARASHAPSMEVQHDQKLQWRKWKLTASNFERGVSQDFQRINVDLDRKVAQKNMNGHSPWMSQTKCFCQKKTTRNRTNITNSRAPTARRTTTSTGFGREEQKLHNSDVGRTTVRQHPPLRTIGVNKSYTSP